MYRRLRASDVKIIGSKLRSNVNGDLLTVDSHLVPNEERYRTLLFSKAKSWPTDKSSPLDIAVIATAGLIGSKGPEIVRFSRALGPKPTPKTKEVNTVWTGNPLPNFDFAGILTHSVLLNSSSYNAGLPRATPHLKTCTARLHSKV